MFSAIDHKQNESVYSFSTTGILHLKDVKEFCMRIDQEVSRIKDDKDVIITLQIHINNEMWSEYKHLKLFNYGILHKFDDLERIMLYNVNNIVTVHFNIKNHNYEYYLDANFENCFFNVYKQINKERALELIKQIHEDVHIFTMIGMLEEGLIPRIDVVLHDHDVNNFSKIYEETFYCDNKNVYKDLYNFLMKNCHLVEQLIVRF